MADYKLFVVVEKRGRMIAARVSRRDYVRFDRALAAASVLAGKRVDSCIIAELSEWQGRLRVIPATVPGIYGDVDMKAVEAAVHRCRRAIISDEITEQLRSAA